jgi:hypothetical protein
VDSDSRKKVLTYFKAPFPPAEGFSPYRAPGLSVHIPILIGFLLLGWSFCRASHYLWPLMVIYFVAGLYMGRDWAIEAHYSPLFTLLVWGGMILAAIYSARIVLYLKRRGPFSPWTALGVTLLVGAVFAFEVGCMTGLIRLGSDD